MVEKTEEIVLENLVVINSNSKYCFNTKETHDIVDEAKEIFWKKFIDIGITKLNKNDFIFDYYVLHKSNELQEFIEMQQKNEQLEVYILNREKISNIMRCSGYRHNKAVKYTNEIFNEFSSIIKSSDTIICKAKLFFSIAKLILHNEFKKKVHLKRYFHLAYQILCIFLFRRYSSNNNFTWWNFRNRKKHNIIFTSRTI